MADYKTAAGDLGEALKPLQKEAVDGLEYRLFGTADQAIEAQPKLSPRMADCREASSLRGFLERPANVAVSGNEVPLAVYAFTNPRTRFQPVVSACHDFVYTGGEDRLDPATLTVKLRLQLLWGPPMKENEPKTVEKVEDLGVWEKSWQVPAVCIDPKPGPEPGPVCSARDHYLDKWVTGGFKQSFAESAVHTPNAAVVAELRVKLTQFLAGRQKEYYDRVVADLATPGKPLFLANAALTQAVRLLQEYTEAGFPTALRGDDLMQGLLRGAERLPGDTPDDGVVTSVFRAASAAYDSCQPAEGPGSPCTAATTFNPFAGQSREWLVDCLSWYRGQLPPDRWSGDPVANTVLAFARHAGDSLRGRFDAHSERLAKKVYTEGIPAVTEAAGLL
ncbi:hypothetical protein, partial [Rhizohabitans arisaemae]|uniref:hypothetical protein n=1 Tax=Rhizohabitans arisaemae TaxID=2720610 RepID=UPI0024B1B385